MERSLMIPQLPGPVKLLAGLLYTDPELLQKALQRLVNIFGPVDYQSEIFNFTVSEYYVPEMGAPIYRQFISFENLVLPDELAEIKLESNDIEAGLSLRKSRKVNIDTGYMDFDKVVLASAKYNGQKIYLSKGIWADLTLQFYKGKYRPYPWSFPDFKSELYQDVFLEIRKLYKKQIKLTDKQNAS